MSNDILLEVNDVREEQQEIGNKIEEMKSDDNSQSVTTLTESQKQLLNDIESATKELGNSHPQKAQIQTKLKRVPKILLQNKKFREYYKPNEISIGPVYAKSQPLFKRELKVKLAAKFISKNDVNKELLFQAIKTNIADLSGHFSEKMMPSDMSNDELSELLFLDGCFMLQFMISYRTGALREFNISNGQAALIKQDLFLLENQIPFQVLKLLMSKLKDENRILRFILYFVMKSNILAPDFFLLMIPPVKKLFVEYKPVHFLDVLRKILIFDSDLCTTQLDPIEETIFDVFEYSPPRSFRNVSEHKLAGIKLKPNESHNLDISFATHFFIIGHFKLPKLIVDDTTIRKLLNLVAYEMSLDDYDTNCHGNR